MFIHAEESMKSAKELNKNFKNIKFKYFLNRINHSLQQSKKF